MVMIDLKKKSCFLESQPFYVVTKTRQIYYMYSFSLDCSSYQPAVHAIFPNRFTKMKFNDISVDNREIKFMLLTIIF